MNFELMKVRFADHAARVRAWLEDAHAIGADSPLFHDRPELDAVRIANEVAVIDGQLERVNTALLTVAVVGEFSSGKSFLISALQGHLRAHQLDGPDGVRVRPVGLLPGGPTPMTSCPAIVMPRYSRSESSLGALAKLSVLFEGDQEWTDLGPVTTPGEIAAYGTLNPDDVVNRRPEHLACRVIEIEVKIDGALLPVTFLDLPGIASLLPQHTEIVAANLARADCFIYVTRANRVLGEAEGELINDLFGHSATNPRKPVTWVLTGIDQEQTMTGSGGQENWKVVKAYDDDYLRETYGRDSASGTAFLGAGFHAVSPLWEALANAEPDPVKEATLRRNSGMDELRDSLVELIRTQSGPAFLVDAAEQMRVMIELRLTIFRAVLRAERSDAEQLERDQERIAATLASLDSATGQRLEWFRRLSRTALDETVRSFSKSDQSLQAWLRTVVTPQIATLDVLKNKDLGRLQAAVEDAARQWFESDGGIGAKWQGETDRLRQRVVEACEQLVAIGRAGHSKSTDVSMTSINVDDLIRQAVSLQASGEARWAGLMKVAGIVWRYTPPTAATISTAATVAAKLGAVVVVGTLGAVLTPVSAVLLVFSAGYAWWRKRSRPNKLEEARKKLASQIDERAEQTMRAFREAVESECAVLEAAILKQSDNLRRPLEEEQRANANVIANRAASTRITERLAALCESGTELESGLQQLVVHSHVGAGG